MRISLFYEFYGGHLGFIQNITCYTCKKKWNPIFFTPWSYSEPESVAKSILTSKKSESYFYDKWAYTIGWHRNITWHIWFWTAQPAVAASLQRQHVHVRTTGNACCGYARDCTCSRHAAESTCEAPPRARWCAGSAPLARRRTSPVSSSCPL